MPSRRVVLVLSFLLGLSPLAAGAPIAAQDSSVAAVELRVRTVVAGLENPWDVQPIGGGGLLVTERDRARLSVVRDGTRHTVRFPRAHVWVSGETGLMSLAVDPEFAETRRFWTCRGWQSKGRHDIRVSKWKLTPSERRARLVRHIVTGLPTTSGRHGGCRLLLDARTPALLVGTGDAADPANPRNLTSLGGKVLRVHRRTGTVMPANPFGNTTDPRQRLIYTYGHRNVQGLAQRPSDGAIVSVEHGTYRDDEVNALSPGADFGWNPGPGYDESVPMTDQSLPGQQTHAIWSSGDPTIATSGAAWTSGSRWGAYGEALAVAALAGERLLLMRFDESLGLVDVTAPAVMRRYGRLRSVTSLPNGDLLVTTSNGSNDRVLRVSPR
ncbi:PQQ-dependent sugar dehydrogenase [Nocardioides sp. B-3]|uniref:PQQ-dependent sugar dehydrogenase n=1 Tax=Nocardioides sp. B-3 TaxID=2895565 RepID=UPI002152D0B9|nr:PQQ-dependent sugar dehydrogenase [Nocardioides sp. B-3]UUZ61761.1 PQQ-dependent sugar dehydrogenase [Nocardioides sp. B-3]